MIKVDIVGGGLSGLSAAISIKEKNKSIEVVVHEKYKKIGYNHEGRRCGEAHTIETQWEKWKPINKSIFNEIYKAIIIVGNEKLEFERAPGTTYILNRQEFICQLEKRSLELGTIIKTNDKIQRLSDLDGDYMIDASGCPSLIKRELGFNRGIKGITYQQTLDNSNCFLTDTIKIIYSGSLGYFWIFPRNPQKKEVNVGVGYAFFGKFNYDLKEKLEKFKRDNNIKGEVNYVTGGMIPCGIQRPLMYKNILFVGDAGIGTMLFTGQGIYRALISGDVAGRCIARGYPSRYPKIMTKYFLKWEVVGIPLSYLNYIFYYINSERMMPFFKSIKIYTKISHF
jgi:flavin-dependent dehydrogenase